MDVVSAASLSVIAGAVAWGITRWRLAASTAQDGIETYDEGDDEPPDAPEPDAAAQELARQLEAARIAAWSARHALTAAQQERDRYRGEVTALRAQLDEEVGRTRLAERLNVAARAARDEAVERRVQLEEALMRVQEANEVLQSQLVHNASDPAELRAAKEANDTLRKENERLLDELLASRKELARVQHAIATMPPASADIAAMHTELGFLKEMVESLIVERDAALTDMNTARAELERIKDRLYKPPARR